jgi:hypothetical protein
MRKGRATIFPGQIQRAVEALVALHSTSRDPAAADHSGLPRSRRVCAKLLAEQDDVQRAPPPILARMRDEVGRTVAARKVAAALQRDDDPVDEASEESFPASDPPAWIWEPASPGEKEK